MKNIFLNIRSDIESVKTILTESAALMISAVRSEGIIGQSIRGGSILTIGSFIENLVRFVRNIILARLMAPEDFGIMAIVIASVAVLEAFTQVGLRQSIIQNKRSEEENFLNAAWIISAIRGIILYLMAYLTAPFVGAYFNKPESVQLLRIGFIIILLNAAVSPRVNILEKKLQFNKWVIIMQGAGIVGVITAIVAALFLKNAWALLLGYLTEGLLKAVMSFLFCPIRPYLKIDRECTYDILAYSKKMFGLPLLMMIYNQLDNFVIGKVLTIELLGMYVLVRSLSDMPSVFFSKIVEPIILPVFSTMQDDVDKLKNTLCKMTELAGLFLIPFTAFFSIFSQPILYIVYGQDFVSLAVPFAIMNISLLILIMSSLIVQMYFAVGQPNIHRNASIARAVLFLFLIYPATKLLGLTGTALASLIAMCTLISVELISARKIMRFSLHEYFNNWTPGIISSIQVIIVGVLSNLLFQRKWIMMLALGIISCLSAWIHSILKIVIFYHKKSDNRTVIDAKYVT